MAVAEPPPRTPGGGGEEGGGGGGGGRGGPAGRGMAGSLEKLFSVLAARRERAGQRRVDARGGRGGSSGGSGWFSRVVKIEAALPRWRGTLGGQQRTIRAPPPASAPSSARPHAKTTGKDRSMAPKNRKPKVKKGTGRKLADAVQDASRGKKKKKVVTPKLPLTKKELLLRQREREGGRYLARVERIRGKNRPQGAAGGGNPIPKQKKNPPKKPLRTRASPKEGKWVSAAPTPSAMQLDNELDSYVEAARRKKEELLKSLE